MHIFSTYSTDLRTFTPCFDDVTRLGGFIQILFLHVHCEGWLVLGHVEVLRSVIKLLRGVLMSRGMMELGVVWNMSVAGGVMQYTWHSQEENKTNANKDQ